MDATIIIAIVPVVLLVAYIVWLVRAKVTEGRDIDLREPITGVVICLVAVLIIGSMTASTVTYTYSEDTNTLYINQNLIDRNQPFDSYGDEVKSVVIGNNCRLIETGTLDSLTNLEYVSIGKNVEVRNGAFGVTFKDPRGTEISAGPGEYVAYDGTMYISDPAIFTYTTPSAGLYVSGLADAQAKYLVLPKEIDGRTVVRISENAFSSSNAVFFGTVPDSKLDSVGNSAFYGVATLEEARFPGTIGTYGNSLFRDCTSLQTAVLLGTADTIQYSVFHGCTALESVTLPDTVTLIGASAFRDCTSLEHFDAPASLIETAGSSFSGSAIKEFSSSTLTTVAGSSFSGCSHLESVSLPSARTIGASTFSTCSAIKSVSFGSDLSTVEANSFVSWTFYESDGTTQIDKTVAANLAGKTFQGTASALVEVAPGQLSLTPQQLQQVQLHTQEVQQQELDLQPLPFQPTVQTQDQEPVAA